MRYTKEFLEPIIKESISMSEVVRKVGRRTDNGFVTYLKKVAKKFDIDISHFKTRSQIVKNQMMIKYPIEDYLSNKRLINSDTLRKKLFTCGLKEQKCEECGITDWNGNYLSFNLHHRDSNHYNNNLDNLMILCPNCHYCIHDIERKNKKRKTKNIVDGNVRESRLRPERRKVTRPSYTQLVKDLDQLNYLKVGKKYGVTDNAIRKWLAMYKKYNELD